MVALGVTCPLAYLYFTLSLLMFILRAHDDGKECERKHGTTSWTRYCQRVRSRLIPYIYWCYVDRVMTANENCNTSGSGRLNCSAHRIGGSDWLFLSWCGIVLPCSVSSHQHCLCVFTVTATEYKQVSYSYHSFLFQIAKHCFNIFTNSDNCF